MAWDVFLLVAVEILNEIEKHDEDTRTKSSVDTSQPVL